MDNDKGILELILDELKEMRFELKNLNSITIKQEENIKVHLIRSENLETLLTITKKELNDEIKELNIEIEPLKTFKANIEGGLKLVGGTAILIGAIVGIFEIFKMVF